LDGSWRKGCALVLLAAFVVLAAAPSSHGVSQATVDGGYSAVQSAFVAAQSAGKEGGNVSGLVAKLNVALGLIRVAVAENSTDPSQAAADLANATQIAQGVSSSAGQVGAAGAAARQLQFYISVGSAVAIVVIAAGVYLYGDRLYRRLWLRVYGGHVVSKVG
jgi:hypothetical protein